jgi:hypothetical protein
VDRNAPVTDVNTMAQVLTLTFAEPRFETSLLSAFALLVLILAVLGTCDLTSYSGRGFGPQRPLNDSCQSLPADEGACTQGSEVAATFSPISSRQSTNRSLAHGTCPPTPFPATFRDGARDQQPQHDRGHDPHNEGRPGRHREKPGFAFTICIEGWHQPVALEANRGSR